MNPISEVIPNLNKKMKKLLIALVIQKPMAPEPFWACQKINNKIMHSVPNR
jgi:hypothetical protein